MDNVNKNVNKKPRKDFVEYGYYSKVLKQPFDSIEELKYAEAKFYDEQKAKVDRATAKKADALKVEESFKALNQARKDYKENLIKLTQMYQEDLNKLKEAFESDRARVQAALADAETAYSSSLKEFTDKYPEGYHITLKDGDFETTISGRTSNPKATEEATKLFDLVDWIFRI